MGITIDIPDGLEGVGESVKKLVDELAVGIKTAKIGRTPNYREVEEKVADRTAEIERRSHQAMLQAFDIDAPRVMIEGKLYRRVLREDSTYHCMVGDFVVTRSLYRECGTRGGKTVDPVSLRVGVSGAAASLLAVEFRARRTPRGRAIRSGPRGDRGHADPGL